MRKKALKSSPKWTGPGQRDQVIGGYLFIAPMMIGFALFVLAPIIGAFVISFTDWPLVADPKYIGLDNYIRMFTADPTFKVTVWNTLYFTILLVPLNIVMTLALALLLAENIRGIGIFRTVIFTPYVTSIVVWAVVWRFIFQTDNGALNLLLREFGIMGPAWLYNMDLGIPVVVTTTLLKGLGLNMIIFIAAIKDIPQMYLEAAKVDGASGFRVFRHITLPLLTPTVFLVMIITTIASLKVFAPIKIMTDGGPGNSTYVLVYYIYQQAFKINDFGYACAISAVLFLMTLALTIWQWKIKARWVYNEEE